MNRIGSHLNGLKAFARKPVDPDDVGNIFGAELANFIEAIGDGSGKTPFRPAYRANRYQFRRKGVPALGKIDYGGRRNLSLAVKRGLDLHAGLQQRTGWIRQNAGGIDLDDAGCGFVPVFQ